MVNYKPRKAQTQVVPRLRSTAMISAEWWSSPCCFNSWQSFGDVARPGQRWQSSNAMRKSFVWNDWNDIIWVLTGGTLTWNLSSHRTHFWDPRQSMDSISLYTAYTNQFYTFYACIVSHKLWHEDTNCTNEYQWYKWYMYTMYAV